MDIGRGDRGTKDDDLVSDLNNKVLGLSFTLMGRTSKETVRQYGNETQKVQITHLCMSTDMY